MIRLRAAIGLSLLLGSALPACSNDGREMRPPSSNQSESIITTTLAPEDPVAFETAALPDPPEELLEISVPWADGDRIPAQFTCRGTSTSPDIAWFDVTADAVGIAVVMYELDDDQTIHWIIANIDPAIAYAGPGELEGPGVSPDAVVGLNDVSEVAGPTQGYRAPCPAEGTSATYTIEVHALGQLVELPSGTPAKDLRSAIDFVSIQRAAVTGYAQG